MEKTTFDQRLNEISNELRGIEQQLLDFETNFNMQKLMDLIKEKLETKKTEVEQKILTTIEVKLPDDSTKSQTNAI